MEPEATVFTNIAQGSADVVRPWVEALRNVGFAVFAKPKVDDNSDVDSDIDSDVAPSDIQREAEGVDSDVDSDVDSVEEPAKSKPKASKPASAAMDA